jgi:hypothetical protein
MTALARPAAVVIDRPVLPSERILRKDYNRKCSFKKLVMYFQGLEAKTS